MNEEVAREFAKKYNALFHVITAKNTTLIENLFLDISKKISGADSAMMIDEKALNLKPKRKRSDSVSLKGDSNHKNNRKFC